MAVALHVLADHRSVQNVERRKQRGRAVPFVVMGHGAGASLLHRQTGLSAVERLDLRLLIDRQHHRMGRRVDIQADDIGEFLGEGRVGRQLEVAPAVRAETVSLPDRLHRRGGNTGRPGHRAQRPVGRRRRLLRQAHDLGDTIERDRRLAGRIPQQNTESQFGLFRSDPSTSDRYVRRALSLPTRRPRRVRGPAPRYSHAPTILAPGQA